MRVLGFAVLASMALSGCAVDHLASRLSSLKGQPVQTVFDRVGYPDRQEKFGDDTVYYWGTDQPVGPSCTFKVAAGSDKLIKSTSVYGNANGCEGWVGRLAKP
jgi:hypothetical protein